MTEVLEKPHTSGWCPPWRHDTDHAKCQQRLDDGRLTTCACPDHNPRKDTT